MSNLYRIDRPIWLLKVNKYNELLISYYKNDILQYGIIRSTDDLTYLINNIESMFNYKIYHLDNFGIILSNYTNTKEDIIKRYNYGNGETIITDYENFLLYKNIVEDKIDKLTVNLGDKRTPEYIDVEVNRKEVVLSITTSKGKLEIYKLKEGVTVVWK